ncbi:MAG TPA: hypothetical protein VNX68_02580 [Nitrosopumilaceae archaeon]|jgi:hypothetical protein|nr:hypothetical protein [Nitrosopumilaceae archaeon]
MTGFAPTNKPLWQLCLAHAVRRQGGSHNNWITRQSAINYYLRYNGGFANSKPNNSNDRLTQINLLASRGIPVTASLMARSLAHQWRQFLAHESVLFDTGAASTENSNLPLILKPQGYFGIKASAFGYELLLPNAKNTRIMISRAMGYTLMSLSRELSRRETKYTDQPQT